jgi:predicted nuclease of predicted toxin-antitoxin system
MRWVADENFDGPILEGLLQQLPTLDILRVQDTALYTSEDPRVLAWAAEENRVLLTHDFKTMIRYALERVKNGLSMPGVVVVRHDERRGQIIADLVYICSAGTVADFEDQVVYVPMD